MAIRTDRTPSPKEAAPRSQFSSDQQRDRTPGGITTAQKVLNNG
ncbi:MAG: hypothetical protein ACYT04_51100 [Nostoc sp.]